MLKANGADTSKDPVAAEPQPPGKMDTARNCADLRTSDAYSRRQVYAVMHREPFAPEQMLDCQPQLNTDACAAETEVDREHRAHVGRDPISLIGHALCRGRWTDFSIASG
jgi:hypothetical protein